MEGCGSDGRLCGEVEQRCCARICRPVSINVHFITGLLIYIYHNRSSNILVGFLEWLKKQPQQSTSSVSIPGGTWTAPSRKPNKPKLSHASLILLLERGRPCGRRVLVASSPLHQGV